MIRTIISSLLTYTFFLQYASANGQNDHWNFMNDLMTQHLTKYTRLFQPDQELMFDEDGENTQDPSRTTRMPIHGVMSQFTDLASIMINSESHRRKQRDKYRKYSAESLPEDGLKSTDEIIEGQRLSELEKEIAENRNGVHLDQNTAQQLHNRFLKKEEDNYLGHFRAVEHKIPREEFEDEHIRRLLQENNQEVETVENPEVVAENAEVIEVKPEVIAEESEDKEEVQDKEVSLVQEEPQTVTEPPADNNDQQNVSDNNDQQTVSDDLPENTQDHDNSTTHDNQNHDSTPDAEKSNHDDHPPVKGDHDNKDDHPPVDDENNTQNLSENQDDAENAEVKKVDDKKDKPKEEVVVAEGVVEPEVEQEDETKKPEEKKPPVVTADDGKNADGTPKVYPPNMDPNVQPKVEIYYVEETYPVKDDKKLGCKNEAKYVEITQLYYFCFLNSAPNNVIRVNNQSYVFLTTLPYYTSRATCYMAEKTHDACYCSAGYTGALCQYQDATKCYVNITSPKLYEGCQDEFEDSEFYMYSIQGFDPCHFFDFNQKTDIKFLMKCLPLTKKGIVKENGHTEKLGLEYADVIKQTVPSEKFSYAAVNPETKMKVNKEDNVLFSFDFRDWKYLTNIKKFQLNVTEPSVIAGLKEGSVTVDFKELVDSDEKSGSRFEVAGRVYWEASISGTGYQSFVTTGFFDKKGYEEPLLSSGKTNYLLEVVLPIAAGILIVVGFVIYKIVQRNKKISEENEQLALMIERQKKQSKKNKNKK